MIKKKGVSGHIEIIISFLIFIAFVSFLLIFINPLKKTSTKDYYLDMTEEAIMEKIATNLTTFSLVFPNVVALSDPAYIDYPPPAGTKLVVKDESGSKVEASSTGSQLCIKFDGSKFYKAYFSEEFAEDAVTCLSESVMPSGNYGIGVLNEYEKVSKKALTSLETQYKDTTTTPNGYETLKGQLGITWDFNVIVKGAGINAVRDVPKNAEVKAKEISIEIIDENGNIVPAIMNIQVW